MGSSALNTRTPRVVLLTGNAARHRFAALRLARRVELCGVLCEEKIPSVVEPSALSPADVAVLAEHFAERDRVETQLLGEFDQLEVSLNSSGEILHGPHGMANEVTTLAWLGRLAPDFIVLYGCSLIGRRLLDAFPNRIVNLHLGLSPYYRGGATNFWPLYYGEPECVGATLHLATSNVDGGPILAQVRPEAFAADRTHELGTRSLIEAVELLPEVLEQYADGRLTPRPQATNNSRVCRRRDFTAESVRCVRKRLDSGMMEDYLQNLLARRRAVPLVELGDGSSRRSAPTASLAT